MMIPERSDAPAALLMGLLFLAFGLFAIFRPQAIRKTMDGLANVWKQDSWHPYKMPLPLMRVVVGSVGIGCSALFFYIGFLALRR